MQFFVPDILKRLSVPGESLCGKKQKSSKNDIIVINWCVVVVFLTKHISEFQKIRMKWKFYLFVFIHIHPKIKVLKAFCVSMPCSAWKWAALVIKLQYFSILVFEEWHWVRLSIYRSWVHVTTVIETTGLFSRWSLIHSTRRGSHRMLLLKVWLFAECSITAY